MDMTIVSNVLGWTSVLLYITLTVFNSMRITRFAAFASAANDIVWSFLMGWWPKFILNLAVSGVNAYRFAKDYTKAPIVLLNAIAALMIAGVGYIAYVAVSTFVANPTLSVGMQFADLGFILAALWMKNLTQYRWLMLMSGFVGMVGYYGNPQMMMIKALVIGIMLWKLISTRKTVDSVATA